MTVADERRSDAANRLESAPLPRILRLALSLSPAPLVLISAALPWAETSVRVISETALPELGVPAGPGGLKLSFVPQGFRIMAGQIALTLGLLGLILAAMERGREQMVVAVIATLHACYALFIGLGRDGSAHLASFESSLAADPLSAAAQLSGIDFQPAQGVLLYLAASYLMLLSSAVDGKGLPLHRRLVAGIDRLNGWVGTGVAWLGAAMVVVGAYNAIARKVDQFSGLSLSSNAYIEAQWYMFSLLFLLGAAWTLREDGHVRVDVLYGRLGPHGKARIDLAGTVLFLMPFCAAALWFSLPSVLNSWQVREISPDPGGLPRYPLKLVLPAALVMIALQGHAMATRQLDILRGRQ